MPFAVQPQAEQITGRERSRLIAGLVVLVIVLAGVGIWAAVRPGGYGASKDGCITVMLPSTTGGALMHQCGADARATCKHAFTATGKVAALTRPQCRLAGLDPAALGLPASGNAG
ncbi:MAG TPA: hypothetical protein VMA95_10275 [Streptosporangiaceae bacterium]|nr:hypothetical protein [Streptosporangiaceae bacterium]